MASTTSFQRNNARARRRLARVRLADRKALPDVKATKRGNFKRSDRFAILRAAQELSKKQRADRKKAAEDNYDPLKPLRGKDMARELTAAERLEFGESDRALGEAFKTNDRNTALTTSAYDQYKQALAEATGRINTANTAAANATQGAVDTAYSQDKAAQEARDKAEAEKQSRFGFNPQAQTEGTRSVEAARSQGNQRAGEIRQQGAADTTYMEGRGATAVQAKAEALGRQGAKREELEGKRGELAAQKGAFRTSHRSKLRSGEREWAAIQQEFGLKERAQTFEESSKNSDNATQRLVAKLYSDASKAKARATIRVAKLQLEKGKIDQKQYREIVNIYKGLPEKGKPTPAKTPGKQGPGSGKNGAWAPHERDSIDKAVNGLRNKRGGQGAETTRRNDYIRDMVNKGVPQRIAEQAWREYIRKYARGSQRNQPSKTGRGDFK